VYYWKFSNISEVLEKRTSKVVDEGHLLSSVLKEASNYIQYSLELHYLITKLFRCFCSYSTCTELLWMVLNLCFWNYKIESLVFSWHFAVHCHFIPILFFLFLKVSIHATYE